MNSQDRLQPVVDRARMDSFFVGHRLTQYQELHGLGDRELAEFLSCTPDAVARLSLCRAPAPDELEYAAQVQRVAEYAGCDANRLVQVLRSSEAVQVLRRERRQDAPNTLLAARDRKHPDGGPKQVEQPEKDE